MSRSIKRLKIKKAKFLSTLNPHKFPDNLRSFLIIGLAVLAGLGLGVWYELTRLAPSQTPTQPGSQSLSCSYLMYVNGSSYGARNCQTGAKDYQGDASTVINNVLTAITATAGVGGGEVFFQKGVYDIKTPIMITGQNIQFVGEGISIPVPQQSNPVSLGLPLTVLQTDSSFPSNKPLLTWNNVNNMINGGSLQDIALDGTPTFSIINSNVTGLHLANVAGFIAQNFVMTGFSDDGILVDEYGALYPSPSTSQLWFNNFQLYKIGCNGMEFPDNLFIGEVFIRNFWLHGSGGCAGIRQGPNNTKGVDFQIGPGTIDSFTDGLDLGQGENVVIGTVLYELWGYGIYVKSAGCAGYKSTITNTLVRDPDKALNGKAGIILDAGTCDYLLFNNVVEKVNRTPEIGIQEVDGYNTNGNYIDSSNRVFGMSLANFKIGGVNYMTKSMPPLTASVVSAGSSPFNYTNNDGYSEQIIVSGGTVSAISICRSNACTITGLTSGSFILKQLDSLVITYSIAPTEIKYPLGPGP